MNALAGAIFPGGSPLKIYSYKFVNQAIIQTRAPALLIRMISKCACLVTKLTFACYKKFI